MSESPAQFNPASGESPAQFKERRKRAETVARWRYDPQQERLRELQEKRPEVYEAVDATAKISLGYYLRDKAAARSAGRDVSR